MIVNPVAADVKMSSFMETKAATMQASAHGMSIMAKQLYTRPVYAVVREILSNAVDANTSVGSKKPVLVIAPSKRDPVLYIRDFGTGISDERMMSDYLCFFSSTKSGENDQIGGFGVGSKSPYAYTTHFTVVSRTDGMKRSYLCFTAPSGIYEIGKLSEEPTTEGDGLEICVPVRERDIPEFINAIKCYAPCFTSSDVRVIGVNDYQADIVYTRDHGFWALVDTINTEYRGAIRRGSYVKVGPIPYEVDWDDLHTSETIEHLIEQGIELRLSIGSVDISPSRETLNMSERTCEAINPLLREIDKLFLSQLQKEIDECETLWDAEIRFLELRSQFPQTFRNHPFTWGGVELEVGLNVGTCEVFPVSKIDNRKFVIGTFEGSSGKIYPSKNLIVVQHDMLDEPRVKVRLRAKLEHLRWTVGAQTIALVKGEGDTTHVPDDRVFRLSEVKLSTHKSTADGPQTPMSGARVYVYNQWAYEFTVNRVTEETSFTDILTDKGSANNIFMVPMIRSECQCPNFRQLASIPSIEARRRHHGSNDIRIVGISAAIARQFKEELKDVQSFEDMCTQRIAELQANTDLIEYVCQRNAYLSRRSDPIFRVDWLSRFLYTLDRDDTDLINAWGWAGGSLLELYELPEPVMPTHLKQDDITDLLYLFNNGMLTDASIINQIEVSQHAILTKIEELTTQYPLLVALRTIQSRLTSREDIITIINAVEGTINV